MKLDQSMVQKLGAHQAADTPAPVTAPGDSVQATDIERTMQFSVQAAEIEKTMQLGTHNSATALPAQVPQPARVRRDVLSGGTQDITNAMVEGRGLNDILRIIVETIYTGIGFDHVAFALREAKRARMRGRFGLGDGIDPLVKAFDFPFDFVPDVFHIALHKNIDVFITDTRDAKIAARIPDWYRKAFAARAFVLLPIIVKDKPFGMLYADAATANAITIQDDELKLLRTLRNQAVLAVRQSG